MTRYMQDEHIKFSVFTVTLFQLLALAGLYWRADYFVSLVHDNL